MFQVLTDIFGGTVRAVAKAPSLTSIVMAIPLWMFQQLQMAPFQKFGLTLMFSIAFVTIALEILRTVKSIQILNNVQSSATPQFAHATYYLAVEVGLNAWISSIAIYRSLCNGRCKARMWFRSRRKESPCYGVYGVVADMEAPWTQSTMLQHPRVAYRECRSDSETA